MSEVATAPIKPKGKRAAVGLWVVYCHGGNPVPAVLTRQGIANPEEWDLSIILPAAPMLSARSAVLFSPEPRDGCWSFVNQ